MNKHYKRWLFQRLSPGGKAKHTVFYFMSGHFSILDFNRLPIGLLHKYLCIYDDEAHKP
jgi:hypothetical protein